MMVRALTRADAEAFREIRLEALQTHPAAYGSTYAQWRDLPLSHYIDRIEGGLLLGLWADEGLQGILAYDRDMGGNALHRAALHAVYLRPAVRGTGAFDRLIAAAVAQARADGVTQLELAVSQGNTRARNAYARLGFAQYGMTPRALRIDGRYVDEILMMRQIGD